MSKTLGVTQYELVNDEHGEYVLIYNGFSSCFDLFDFDNHIFSRIDSLTSHSPGSDVFKILDYAEGYDKIYCSVTSDYELDYLRPVLDKRWVVGGPAIQNTNVDLNVPCETTKKFVPEYFGISNYDYTYYSTYFDQIMKLYPKRMAFVHANIGGICYWNKCRFCKFNTGRRPPLVGNALIQFLENIDKSKSHFQAHLANPAVLPSQLETIIEYSPRKKNWLQVFVRSDREINEVFEKFSNGELKNVLVGLGIETPSETIRNDILNKNLSDEGIFEMIEHVLRLDGTLELSVMSNYFFATKKCVDESRAFVKELEKMLPPEKVRLQKMDEVVLTRWPLRSKEWLKESTMFEVEEVCEKEFGYHCKVTVPKDSDIYKYNQEMSRLWNNAKFNTEEYDMYMGDPNE